MGNMSTIFKYCTVTTSLCKVHVVLLLQNHLNSKIKGFKIIPAGLLPENTEIIPFSNLLQSHSCQ